MSHTVKITIDKSSPVPLYHQLAQGLEGAILGGDLGPGCRVEKEMDLADRLHVSRSTVRQAMEQLVRAGLLVRRRGSGTQVAGADALARRRRADTPFPCIRELVDPLEGPAGGGSSVEVLDGGRSPAGEQVAQQLGIEAGEEVFHVVRRTSAGGEPLALLESWIPCAVAELSPDALGSVRLDRVLRDLGVDLHSTRHQVGAVIADDRLERALRVLPGAVLLVLTSTSFDGSGRPVEAGRHVFRADRHVVEVDLTAPSPRRWSDPVATTAAGACRAESSVGGAPGGALAA